MRAKNQFKKSAVSSNRQPPETADITVSGLLSEIRRMNAFIKTRRATIEAQKDSITQHEKKSKYHITLGAAIGYSSDRNNSNLKTPPMYI